MKKYITGLIAVLIVVSLGILIPSCGKDDEEVIIKDNVKLPEENADLLNVIINDDTLYFIYKSGSSIPTFQQGNIVVGQKNGGYLKEVQSTSTKADTLVLFTEQAALTDAIERVSIDTIFTLSPEGQQMSPIHRECIIEDKSGRHFKQKIKSGEPQLIPMGELFEIRIPDVTIEIYDAGNDLAVSMKIDTIIMRKSIDIDLNLQIDGSEVILFRMVGSSEDAVDFKGVTISLIKSVSAEEELELLPPIPLPPPITIVIPTLLGPLPVVFVFELVISVGGIANLTLTESNTIANNVNITNTNSVGAEYVDGAWNPIWDYTFNGNCDWTYNPSGSISARAEAFLKGSLNCKIYGIAGPSLYLRPYLYDEISYPPFDIEIGGGISAGLGFKVKILSWALVDYNYTFLDYSVVLYHSSNSPPNIPTTPSGPSSGYVDSTYTFSSSATDPDGDSIAIRFAWGDGDTSSWSSYRPSGSSVSMSHSWTNSGTYSVKAQARDVNTGFSNWSNGHSIIISETNGWNIQKIDTAGYVGWCTSIVLDASSRPHISYHDWGNDDLKYAYWTGSSWNIQTVDATGSVGIYTSIALDGSGRPHISYYDDTNYDLKYAYWTGF